MRCERKKRCEIGFPLTHINTQENKLPGMKDHQPVSSKLIIVGVKQGLFDGIELVNDSDSTLKTSYSIDTLVWDVIIEMPLCIRELGNRDRIANRKQLSVGVANVGDDLGVIMVR